MLDHSKKPSLCMPNVKYAAADEGCILSDLIYSLISESSITIGPDPRENDGTF